MSKKWYVLHTYSGYENKVKSALESRIETMGLENNVFAIEIPTEVVAEIKEGGRRVESEKKVFPGYVLVRMDLDDRSWAAVRNTPGVTGFVGSDGKPAPLTREEYNKIMEPRGSAQDLLEPGSRAVRQGRVRRVRRLRGRRVRGVAGVRQGQGHGVHLRTRDPRRAHVQRGCQDLVTTAIGVPDVDRGFSRQMPCR